MKLSKSKRLEREIDSTCSELDKLLGPKNDIYNEEYQKKLIIFLKGTDTNYRKNFYIQKYINQFTNSLFGYNLVYDEKIKMINDFQSIMSIYLKIEWDIAKKGK